MIGRFASRALAVVVSLVIFGLIGIAVVVSLVVFLLGLASGVFAVYAGLWLLSTIPALPVVMLTLGLGTGLWWGLSNRKATPPR